VTKKERTYRVIEIVEYRVSAMSRADAITKVIDNPNRDEWCIAVRIAPSGHRPSGPPPRARR
jgi:hypothetical protein